LLGVNDVNRFVGISHEDHLHDSAANAATHDEKLPVTDLAWIPASRAGHYGFDFFDRAAVLLHVFDVVLVPSKVACGHELNNIVYPATNQDLADRRSADVSERLLRISGSCGRPRVASGTLLSGPLAGVSRWPPKGLIRNSAPGYMKPPREFQAVEGRPGWHKTSTDDWPKLEARVWELHEQFPAPIQVVCGFLPGDDGHAIYLIEDGSAIEVAREFETGSHNAFAGVETEQVCDELSCVLKVAPFRPYFADAAGYKAKFLDRLTARQAQAIERILTVGLEGYLSEWSGDGPIMAETLVEENGLRLWWD
jgi:hypothetical protein